MTDYAPNHTFENTIESLNKPMSLHKPRILLLYGSLREESYSRKAAIEARKILQKFGAETKIYDPAGLPVFDRENYEHPKVKELHELAMWSEGMVWSSLEIHGNMTSVIKTKLTGFHYRLALFVLRKGERLRLCR